MARSIGVREDRAVPREDHATLRPDAVVSVVVPALDEQDAIGAVIADLPRARLREIVVVDNGSTDATAARALAAGARVVHEPRRGYGQACLTGIAALAPCDVVAFLDADHSDHADELPRVLEPILAGRADLVIGSRALGTAEPGALLPQQRFGNWLATRLVRLLWGVRCTDLGPFRAITRDGLARLALRDRDFGWTIEMQVRAIQEGLRVVEVPVSYRRRVGRSKIAGTVRGTLRAGGKILWTIAILRLRGPRRR